MYDCHAHLSLDDFDHDRHRVLERARRAGVEKIVLVGEGPTDNQRVLEVYREAPELLKPCFGFHPDRFTESRTAPRDTEIDVVLNLARRHSGIIAGIGEVGLDYWYVKTAQRRELQKQCLVRMAALADELDLPLNVHSRSAGKYALEALAAAGARRVLMHAFDGKAGHALQAAESHGWIFSIPPSVIRSAQKQRLVRVLPLASLALESDSPVLGPKPDQRNEPANLTHVVRYIARTKKISEEQVREITTENARSLFEGN